MEYDLQSLRATTDKAKIKLVQTYFCKWTSKSIKDSFRVKAQQIYKKAKNVVEWQGERRCKQLLEK